MAHIKEQLAQFVSRTVHLIYFQQSQKNKIKGVSLILITLFGPFKEFSKMDRNSAIRKAIGIGEGIEIFPGFSIFYSAITTMESTPI